MMKNLLLLTLILMSTNLYAQQNKITFKLYALKEKIALNQALEHVHPDFSHEELSESELDETYWQEITKVGDYVTLPAGGIVTMQEGKFHVLELSGVEEVYKLNCSFDPALTGFVGHKDIDPNPQVYIGGEDDWLNYTGVSSEVLGVRYDSGDKKGYLFRAPKPSMGKNRTATCYNMEDESQRASITIKY
ncbi:MAG TPA: hypothetical protein PKC21_10690 [Oligoflexia bacterium]|nr:hypothetical protein [Oligoflexia bacterium]HMR25803.1 hypothetical protein [Oligoflexia bacterium]